MRCFYLNYTFDYLLEAHKKHIAFNAANHAAKPDEIVFICANKQQDRQLYGFLARAQTISSHSVRYYIPNFHRPNNTVNHIQPLTDIVRIPSSVCGDLSRAGVPNSHKQRTRHYLEQFLYEPKAVKLCKTPEVITVVKAKEPTSEPKKKSSSGYVYILKHKTYPGLYKIGITTRLEKRMKELDVPNVNTVVGHWKSTRYKSFEDVLHKMFEYQLPGTEYFTLNKDDIALAFRTLNAGAELITDPSLLAAETSVVKQEAASKPVVVYTRSASKPVVCYKQPPITNEVRASIQPNISSNNDGVWIAGAISCLFVFVFFIVAAASAAPVTSKSTINSVTTNSIVC